MKVSDVRCIVFDFGFTLSSDLYFKELKSDALRRVQEVLFSKNSPEMVVSWMTGRISALDVAAYLSDEILIPARDIHAALVRGCSRMRFNEAVWSFAREQRDAGRKLVLTTANADVFTDVVVPSHRLAEVFDVIVNSADYGEGYYGKEALWARAFKALGEEYGYASSLLIEDTISEVERFRELGGLAHHYIDDDEFLRWRASVGM